MYNLFVSGNEGSWSGDPWIMDAGRCVNEYTDNALNERFGKLNEAAVVALKRLPCIFAYEAAYDLAPKFGLIRDVAARQRQVRVEYQLLHVEPFLTANDLNKLTFELDIGDWEMNRTHWAVKDINLPKELHAARGIVLPPWTRQATKAVDISRHNFAVGLSFPGEARTTVEKVAEELESRIGPDSYFYDNNYVSQLARPSLDMLLQDIYRRRSQLIMVFLSSDYQRKEWCGLEFRAIREIIMERDHLRIMFVRTDDGPVEGVFKTDGYVDARSFPPGEIARFICERVDLLGDIPKPSTAGNNDF